MKKCYVLILCAALLLSLTACVQNHTQPSQPAIGGDPATWGPAVDGGPKVPAESSGNVEIPNPFAEYDTLADAAAAAGFELSVPDSMDGYTDRCIRVLTADESKMIELIYKDGENNEVRIRKAPGEEDISGDYNRYDRTETAGVGEYDVTLKGNGDDVNLATWTGDGYSYSIYFSAGVPADTVSRLIASVG